MFEPIDVHTQRLEAVVPSYEALFTFALSNNTPIKLQVGTSTGFGIDNVAGITYRKWSRENNQKPIPLRLISIRLDE